MWGHILRIARDSEKNQELWREFNTKPHPAGSDPSDRFDTDSEFGPEALTSQPQRRGWQPSLVAAAEMDNPVLSFGTEYGDSYYPAGRFYFNAAELQDKVIPIALRAELTQIARSDGQTMVARAKKKI